MKLVPGKNRLLLLLLVSLAVLLTACGGGEEVTADPADAPGDVALG